MNAKPDPPPRKCMFCGEDIWKRAGTAAQWGDATGMILCPKSVGSHQPGSGHVDPNWSTRT